MRKKVVVNDGMAVEVEEYGTRGDGFEYPDPRPVEVPTRLKLPQRQVDRVRELVRREMSQAAQAEGYESFEEADDFEMDGEDPVSPYEEVFEPVVREDIAPAKRLDPKGGAASADAPGKPVKVDATKKKEEHVVDGEESEEKS